MNKAPFIAALAASAARRSRRLSPMAPSKAAISRPTKNNRTPINSAGATTTNSACACARTARDTIA